MRTDMRSVAVVAAVATSVLLASTANAHSTSTIGGFGAGAAHPITGVDHTLAMVAVGMLAARMGGRAVWALPGAFVSLMAVGGVLAKFGVPLPAVEQTIAASVVVLGVLLALTVRLPMWTTCSLAGFFAIFHGHAHMTDSAAANNVGYIGGFLLATAGLHAVGLVTGTICRRLMRADLSAMLQPTRWVGLGIAAAGLMIWTGLI